MTSEQVYEKPPILLVDDEPEILISLKGLLRRQFTLFTATTGDEALEILRNQTIHVIMTDQRMPNMTGAELLIKAKEQSADSIRIVFTGYADIKAVVDAVNHGQLYRYITKPWDPDELVEMLHEAADQYAGNHRRRHLFSEMKTFLDDALTTTGDLSGGLNKGTVQQRGEILRRQIQQVIELDNAQA